MILQQGSQLSHYRLVEPIGEGGMGVVWKATDTVLGRTVAVKILPDLFAGDQERLARFEQEARLLASLNHPNIAAIHGLEKAEGVRFLVLEMVSGETLAGRLEKGRLPPDECLVIGRQMAEALEAAHEKGIIHRDLKPANVKWTDDGVVKLLDFGLAKALAGEAQGGALEASPTFVAQSPTITTDRTRAGTILGTAAYMSPEQARGKPVDKRTDIWGFGCVLYECLTGTKPFPGETVTDILGAIIHVEPDWAALPPRTPERVRRLLQHCLEKDAKRRLRDIGDARIELEGALAARRSDARAAAVRTKPPGAAGGRRNAVMAAAIGLLLGAGLGIAGWRLVSEAGGAATMGRERGAGVKRLSLAMPEGIRAAGWGLAPDGDRLIVRGIETDRADGETPARRLYVRKLDSFEFEPIPGSEETLGFLLSADGKSVAFARPVERGASQMRIWSVPIDGSAPPLALATWRSEWETAASLPGGDLLITQAGGRSFLRLPEEMSGEGTLIEVKFDDAETSFAQPVALPDDRAVLLNATSYDAEGWQIDVALMELDSGETRILIESGGQARYVPTGHLLFTRGETMLAVPFDLRSLEPTGRPEPLMNGLRASASWQVAYYQIADDGTLVYPPGGLVASDRMLAVVDGEGRVAPFLDERRPFELGVGLHLTADGRRLAAVIGNPNGIYEIWASDADRPGLRRLVAYPGEDCQFPLWSGDGQRIAFTRRGRTEKDGIYVRSAEGGDEPVRVLAAEPSPGIVYGARGWAPDGSWLLVFRIKQGKWDVLRVPLPAAGEPAGQPSELLAEPYNEWGGEISPDGRWLAYASDGAGTASYHVAPLRADGTLGRSVQVGEAGNGWYQWGPDGRSIIYADQGALKSLPLRLEPSVRGMKPVEIADLEAIGAASRNEAFQVLADGRVVFVRRGGNEGDVTRFNVVLDFFDELRRRVPIDAR